MRDEARDCQLSTWKSIFNFSLVFTLHRRFLADRPSQKLQHDLPRGCGKRLELGRERPQQSWTHLNTTVVADANMPTFSHPYVFGQYTSRSGHNPLLMSAGFDSDLDQYVSIPFVDHGRDHRRTCPYDLSVGMSENFLIWNSRSLFLALGSRTWTSAPCSDGCRNWAEGIQVL